jgi:alanine dehydrogenase
MCVNIAVLKETTPGEHHVALVPGVVPGLIKLGGRRHMKSGAAEGIGLADAVFPMLS